MTKCNPIGGAHIPALRTKIAQEFPDPRGLAHETRQGGGVMKNPDINQIYMKTTLWS